MIELQVHHLIMQTLLRLVFYCFMVFVGLLQFIYDKGTFDNLSGTKPHINQQGPTFFDTKKV